MFVGERIDGVVSVLFIADLIAHGILPLLNSGYIYFVKVCPCITTFSYQSDKT